MDADPSAATMVDPAVERSLLIGETQERIAGPVINSMRVCLSGSIDAVTSSGDDLGRASQSMRIRGATLCFARSPQQETALSALFVELQKPLSRPLLRQLPQTMVAAQFGLAKSDIDKVVSWMKSQRLDTITVSPWRSSVTFSGYVAAVEAAFMTRVHRYRTSEREYLANIYELSVPAALAQVMSGVGISTPFRRNPDHEKKNRTGRSGV